jgi:hypothetical protein
MCLTNLRIFLRQKSINKYKTSPEKLKSFVKARSPVEKGFEYEVQSTF